MSMGTRVSLDDVSVTFDALTALDDISLDIAPGEFFTLVGPSGCGKTTTLRVLAGLEPPTTGTVRLGGTDVSGVPPEDRSVGIVFQNYALFPHMSVRENVAYPLEFREPPEGQSVTDRVDELLDLVDMSDAGDREPSTLSGGQQQRIALARALAPGPDVLLLDEPLSALDARLRERLRLTVREIQRKLGITTVYVTHDQSEALAISDRVGVMHDGHIEQVGTPETVYRSPATRFVASFVGDTSIFEGTVTDDRSRIQVGDGSLPVPSDATPAPGAQVSVSVRPEAFTLSAADEDSPDSAGIVATIDHVEFTGPTYRVHCDWNGQTILVTTRADTRPTGPVKLTASPEDTHLLGEE